jgi:hypothetical protein
MLRKLITTVALGATILAVAPPSTLAQPPSPSQLVHKIDRGARHVVSDVDRNIRAVVRPRPGRAAHRRFGVRCRDGRVHFGRTASGACAAHGGVRIR